MRFASRVEIDFSFAGRRFMVRYDGDEQRQNILIVDITRHRDKTKKQNGKIEDSEKRGTRHNADIMNMSSVSFFVVDCIVAAKMK